MTIIDELCPVEILDIQSIIFCGWCLKASQKVSKSSIKGTVERPIHIKTCPIKIYQEFLPLVSHQGKNVSLFFKYNQCPCYPCRFTCFRAKPFSQHIDGIHRMNTPLDIKLEDSLIKEESYIDDPSYSSVSNNLPGVLSNVKVGNLENKECCKTVLDVKEENVDTKGADLIDSKNKKTKTLELANATKSRIDGVETEHNYVVNRQDTIQSDAEINPEEILAVENHQNYLLEKTKNHLFTCKFCDFKSQYRYNTVGHLTLKHYTCFTETLVDVIKNSRTYRCVECGFVADSTRLAASHFLSYHMECPSVVCELCDVKLAEICRLSDHIKTENHKELFRRSIRCKKCPFATLSSQAFKKHKMESHKLSVKSKTDVLKQKKLNPMDSDKQVSKRQRYSCDFDECCYSSDSISHFHEHKVMVHEFKKDSDNTYSCSECDYKTVSKTNLYKHKKHSFYHK